MKRVVLAMSGGVDSSAAAVLLQEQGYEVIGLFMRSGATEEQSCATGLGITLPVVSGKSNKQGCCSASDAADARRVADRLDIPFHALNFQDAFGRIKDYFADEYLAGRTPNPCVMCNNWLKFGKLWDFAQKVGAEYIASGHYARIEQAALAPQLDQRGELTESTTGDAAGDAAVGSAIYRGRDGGKDQSYVLFGIDRAILDRVIFPVGNFDKPDVREKAQQSGLRVHDKADSQEICFIPDNDYAGFLERYRGKQDTAGEIVDTVGTVLGRHEGYERYTVGQRKGLGLAFGEPRYVVRLEPETRRVVIGTREQLGCHTLEGDRVNWLIDHVPSEFRCEAQIRYGHRAAPAEVELLSDDRVKVTFDEPQFAAAPGQAVVLYAGDRVLGGGWIC
ncbi:MAG: tRNA 2-thiouridine(34) synthase MnmA [Rhodopirellula sp.]|nr:tRNA 2-thiouridine(34) synthase MnmA [Rhodopirellula sp.]